MDVYGAREDPVPGVTGALVADAVPLPAGAGAVRAVLVGGGARRSPRGPGPATWWSPWAPATCRWSARRCSRRCAPGDGTDAGRTATARTRPGEPDRNDDPGPHRPVAAPAAERRPAAPVTPLARRRRARPRRRSRRPVQLAAGGAGAGRRRLGAAGQPAARRAHGPGRRRHDAARRPGAGDRRHRRRARRCCGSTSTPPGRRVARLPQVGVGRGHPRLAAHASWSPWSSATPVAVVGRARAAVAGRRRRACCSTPSPGRPRPASSRSTCPTPGPDDPATMAALAAVDGAARATCATQVASAAATTAEDITLTLHRRHARALGRPGGLRPQGVPRWPALLEQIWPTATSTRPTRST